MVSMILERAPPNEQLEMEGNIFLCWHIVEGPDFPSAKYSVKNLLLLLHVHMIYICKFACVLCKGALTNVVEILVDPALSMIMSSRDVGGSRAVIGSHLSEPCIHCVSDCGH